MKKMKLIPMLTAAIITASTVAGIATPAFATENVASTRTLVFSDYLCNATFENVDGEEIKVEHNENDRFELAFESVNQHQTLADFLMENKDFDVNTLEITFDGWKQDATDKQCNPITAKEWTVTSNIGTFKIYDKEDVITPEVYELNYTDDNAELRILTSKINKLQTETKNYYNYDKTEYVEGPAYTTEYEIEDGVATVTVYKNGKYFWSKDVNKSLDGLQIFEKDAVLTAKITLDADAKGIDNFVHNIYRVALNRTPDEDGFNFWTNSLRSQDWAGRQVLLNLLDTPEFRELNLSAEEFVNRMYNVINNRAADEEGFNYWVNRYNEVLQYKIDNCTLHDGCQATENANKHIGDTRLEILDYMMNESEFKERCESMGIRF